MRMIKKELENKDNTIQELLNKNKELEDKVNKLENTSEDID
ncbi:hypothetical protein [Romboutsia ilealis]|nr:hypothetical protein [Romboutsia ilealis]